jgi:hypothetical protein
MSRGGPGSCEDHPPADGLTSPQGARTSTHVLVPRWRPEPVSVPNSVKVLACQISNRGECLIQGLVRFLNLVCDGFCCLTGNRSFILLVVKFHLREIDGGSQRGQIVQVGLSTHQAGQLALFCGSRVLMCLIDALLRRSNLSIDAPLLCLKRAHFVMPLHTFSGYPPHPRAWPLFRSPSLSVQTRVPPWFIPNSARLAFVPDQSRRARVQP